MKDYYRILGLKETATAEEIHHRWIELMQKYHPDHNLEGKHGEEMAKEINEAYQVLKHSSSRMGYDFERHHQRSMKRFSMRKLVFPASGVTIILIFALFLFKKPETPVSLNQQPELPSPKITVPYKEPAPQVVSSREPSDLERTATIEKEEEVSYQSVREEKKTLPPASTKPVEASLPTVRAERSAKSAKPSASAESGRSRPVEKHRPTKISERSKKVPAAHSVTDSGASAEKVDRPLVAKLPPPVATEQEVKKLFNYYVERYNQKDIKGFLSLFSSKALQNQKDELEGIRRIYENFFHQSLELRYSVEDMKVEVYQNAVEVKARYQVDQISRIDGERKIWKGRIQWMLVKEDGALRIISLNYKHDNDSLRVKGKGQ
jgi:curved DNA-binding protein CbpA